MSIDKRYLNGTDTAGYYQDCISLGRCTVYSVQVLVSVIESNEQFHSHGSSSIKQCYICNSWLIQLTIIKCILIMA